MLGRRSTLPLAVFLIALFLLVGPAISTGPSSSEGRIVVASAAGGPRTVDPDAVDEHAVEDRSREDAERLRAETEAQAAREAQAAEDAAQAELARQAAARAQRPTEPVSRAVSSDVEATVALGRQMAAERGWTGDQWECLYQLWARESGWRVEAHNPSGAYGVPQAMPGSKMGPGWENDPVVQIGWGLEYIAVRFGSPCAADSFQRSTGWY